MSRPHCILIPRRNGTYRVTNIGKIPFWPYEGDIITNDGVQYIREHRDWKVTISKNVEEDNDVYES